MGTDSDVGFPQDGEGPAREVTVESFYVDKFAVTNAQFLEFVRETGYTTEAEQFGWSFVFEDFLAEEDEKHVFRNVPAAPWLAAVEGATWFRPTGPSSNVVEDDLLKHPVTHVSHRDAAAYAEWAGKRLPTEAEWECAARGGLEGTRFPWGEELEPDDEHRCNVWQGEFPEHNTGDDGYVTTAPVNEFEPNGYGVYNVSGNVWEWCRDWFSADHHTTDAYDHDNPTGPDDGTQRVMRGGSHLCHRSWCNRYRVAARSKNTLDSSTDNIGFRCVVDAVVEEVVFAVFRDSMVKCDALNLLV
jgi:formylglycine-generating enzyme required for sulfatase activity